MLELWLKLQEMCTMTSPSRCDIFENVVESNKCCLEPYRSCKAHPQMINSIGATRLVCFPNKSPGVTFLCTGAGPPPPAAGPESRPQCSRTQVGCAPNKCSLHRYTAAPGAPLGACRLRRCTLRHHQRGVAAAQDSKVPAFPRQTEQMLALCLLSYTY